MPKRERNLTPVAREKRDGIMALLARLRSVTRRERLAREGKGSSEPRRKSGKHEPSLMERGMRELGKQTVEQLKSEAKSIRKQIKREKAELQKMLAVE